MTRKFFPNFFPKSSNTATSVQVVQTESPQNRENEELGELSKANTSSLHRSRSGRLKEKSRVRLAIAGDTYVAPEQRLQSAPPTRSGIGLAGRELSMHETIRLSRSLQPHINGKAPKDLSSSDASSLQAVSAYDLADENEIF